MPANAIVVAALVIASALGSVFVVFRYLEVSSTAKLDIETTLGQIKNVRCEVAWGSAQNGGKGGIFIGDGRARIDYIYTRNGNNSTFSAVLDGSSGDLFVWPYGESTVVQLKSALTRGDIDDRWWNSATLSNCKPVWIPDTTLTAVPRNATITER